MVISKRKNFICFSNGKVASTTLDNLFGSYHDSDLETLSINGLFSKRHLPPSIARTYYNTNTWNMFYKFSFVRNPYDWIISCYLYKYRLNYIDWFSKSRRNPGFLFHIIRKYPRYKKNSTRNFFDKTHILDIKERLRTSRVNYFSSTLLQSCYTHDIDNVKIVDFIGKFEKLDSDYVEICRKLSIIPKKLNHLNKSCRSNSVTFTKDATDIVRQVWELDFINFKYSLNTPDFIKVEL